MNKLFQKVRRSFVTNKLLATACCLVLATACLVLLMLLVSPVIARLYREEGITATLVVAASNSSPQSKAQADFVAAGVADQVTIQTAIDALPVGGGKVLLMEGTFIIADQIHMRSKVTLGGIGWASVIKLRDGLNIPEIQPIIIGSNVSDWRITNLKIDCNRRGQTFADWIRHYTIGIRIKGSRHVTIDNVLIVNGGTGMDAQESLGVRNSHITISNNHIRDMFPGDGIGTNNLNHSTIVGNTTTDTREEGIDLHSVRHTTVVGNTIHNVTVSHGIGLRFDSSHNTITGNTIVNTPWNGIFIRSDVEATPITHTIIANNSLKNTGRHGIHIEKGTIHTIIEGNSISSAGIHGIFMHNSHHSIITGNQIKHSGYHGIFLDNCNDSLISNNHITESSQTANNTFDGINIFQSSRNTIAGNIIRTGDLTNKPRYGIAVEPALENIIRDNDLRNSGVTGAMHILGTPAHAWKQHSNIFMNVLAASVTHVRPAITPDGLSHTAVPSPDVPRNTMIRITNTHATLAQTPSGGNIVIHGVSAKGRDISETIVVPATSIPAGGTSDVFGSKAFATVSSVDYYSETNTNIAVSVGISNRLGLSNVIYAAGDVFKVTKNAADVPVGTVDPANGTVDVGPITTGDDFTIRYRSNLNIMN